MNEYAWTDGPWHVGWNEEGSRWVAFVSESGAASSGRYAITTDAYPEAEEDVFGREEADAALIALAPEMAAAILEWDECDECPPMSVAGTPLPRLDCDKCGGKLAEMAEQLRAINEEHSDA